MLIIRLGIRPSVINGNSVKKAPLHKKAPPIAEKFLLGAAAFLSYVPPKAENLGDSLKMIIFLRKIGSESFEKPNFFRLRRAKSEKS